MSLQEIRNELEPELKSVEQLMRRDLTSGSPLMDKVVNTYFRTNGKQLRPMVLILCSKIFGEVNENTIASAASVEILHNASLIHDDIVDESEIRRSRPTINAMWDSHVAVLVGDFFVSTAMQEAISTGNILIINSLCHLGKLLSLGEIDQVYSTDIHEYTQETYYKISSYKTASLFVACAKMGCFSQGLSSEDERVKRLAQFAEHLGLCFQLRDDIFDYLSNTETIGKPTGNDLKEGKVTLPLIYALSTLSPERRKELSEEIHRDRLSDIRISELIDFAVKAGGIEYSFREMERLKEKAFAALDIFPASDRNVELLRQLFLFTISREF